MDFFIKDDNVRPGNRGGRDQFKWDDVRLLNNKEREHYLGVSQTIGFLDKSGKWRKRDWWQNYKPEGKVDSEKLKLEREKIKKEEEEMLLNALNPNAKKHSQYADTNKPQNTDKKLTDFQWTKLTKKEAVYDANLQYMLDDNETENRMGLGVKVKMSMRNNPLDNQENIAKLDGVGISSKDTGFNGFMKDNINVSNYISDYGNKVGKSNNVMKNCIKEYLNKRKKSFNSDNSFNNKDRSRSKEHSKSHKKRKHKHHHGHKHSHSYKNK